jgi:hypothetical protein
MSIRAAGIKHKIPEATVRHKLSGYHPVSMQKGPPTLLTEAEELVLMNYIRGTCKRAQSVTKSNVLNAVKTILDDEIDSGIIRKLPPSFHDGPKEKWWRLFKERHPTLNFRSPEALSTAQTITSDEVIEKLKLAKEERDKKIQPKKRIASKISQKKKTAPKKSTSNAATSDVIQASSSLGK